MAGTPESSVRFSYLNRVKGLEKAPPIPESFSKCRATITSPKR
jgi:hypothetical protein